jgi:hypothetical protein
MSTMPAAVAEVGPGNPYQRVSKFYSLVSKPNRPSSKHGASRVDYFNTEGVDESEM